MKILLSNDDGYEAPGLLALFEAVSQVADVIVVAPETNCSGSSNALTLRKPIRVHSHKNGFISVQGTPADCVHLAITGMLAKTIGWQPDIVVSGINNGSNLGDDVIYSGTVAAAIEGRFLRLPAIAVSLAGEALKHFDTAAQVVLDLLEKINTHPMSGHCLLNLNVPDLPYNQINGMEVTRLGKRSHSEPIISEPAVDGDAVDGDNIYRIGRPGAEEDAGAGTDFYAVNQGKVSITPLTIDMTHYKNIPVIDDWLNN